MDNVKPVRACTVFYLLRRLKAMLRVVQMRLEKTFKVFFYLLCIMNKDDYVTMFETAILTLDTIALLCTTKPTTPLRKNPSSTSSPTSRHCATTLITATPHSLNRFKE